MPKSTFLNLAPEKQAKIVAACRAEFEAHCLSDASVANIIARLGVARGTFYKYFEDLETCYFYVLAHETKEIHDIFIDLLQQNQFDIITSLERYGGRIADEIHNPENYALYCNRFLGWTPFLQSKWQNYCQKNRRNQLSVDNMIDRNALQKSDLIEVIHLVKTIVHDLIARNFIEKWTKQQFINTYHIHIELLIKGLKNFE